MRRDYTLQASEVKQQKAEGTEAEGTKALTKDYNLTRSSDLNNYF